MLIFTRPSRCGLLDCVFSLNSSDVDYNTAASASCVRPVVFKKMLGVVQDLVEIEPLKSRTEEYHGDIVTYEELMQAFRLRHYQSVLLGWFESAEAALLGSGELRGSDLKAVKNVTLLRCVVFAWVCEVSKVRSFVRVPPWICLGSNSFPGPSKSQRIEPEIVKLKFELPSDIFDDLMTVMTAACSHVKAQIRQDRQALLKNHTPASSANPTPSKPHSEKSASRSVSKSPSKSALKRKLSALDRAEQNTPSKRVAFMKSVPEVDEGESSEDDAVETPSKQRVRLFADEVAAAVTPMAKLRPDAGSTSTARSRFRSRASTSQRTLEKMPEDEENPMRVDPPPAIPTATLVSAIPRTPRRNRTTPSTPKRTPGSRTRAGSTPRRNDEDGVGDQLALPPRYRPVFLDHRQWYARDPRIEKEVAMGEELRRSFMEKFGQSIIDKYRPTAAT